MLRRYVFIIGQDKAENWGHDPEAEFKEFERRIKFQTRLKHGWANLNLYSKFEPALIWSRFLAVQQHGSNSALGLWSRLS